MHARAILQGIILSREAHPRICKVCRLRGERTQQWGSRTVAYRDVAPQEAAGVTDACIGCSDLARSHVLSLVVGQVVQVSSDIGLIFKVERAMWELAAGLDKFEYIDCVEVRAIAVENTGWSGARDGQDACLLNGNACASKPSPTYIARLPVIAYPQPLRRTKRGRTRAPRSRRVLISASTDGVHSPGNGRALCIAKHVEALNIRAFVHRLQRPAPADKGNGPAAGKQASKQARGPYDWASRCFHP